MSHTINDLLEGAKCYHCIPPGMRKAVKIYLACQWANSVGPSPPVYDPDALAYMNRLTAAGTDITGIEDDINTFVLALKADNTWTALDAIYPFLGDNSAGNALNAKPSGLYDITWNGAFTTNDRTGVKSNGASGYGDTSWTATVQNAGTMFAFIYTGTTGVGLQHICGSLISPPNIFTQFQHNGSTAFNYNYNDGSSGMVALAWAYPNSVCEIRTLANHLDFYADGSAAAKGTSAAVTSGPSIVPLFLFARDNLGVPVGYYDGKLQGFAMGVATLAATQYQTLHNAWVALNAAIGR
jgi:hypothetical protein